MIYKTLKILESKYKLDIKNIKIEDVRIGVFETAIELTGKLYGIASTMPGGNTYCYRDRRDIVPFSPGQIRGQYIVDLFGLKEDTKITKCLKVAALNALSSPLIQNTGFKWIEICDPFDLLDLSGKKVICVVGAFKTYIEKIVAGGHRLHVLEFDKEAISETYQKYFIHTNEASTVLPKCDIAIITGSSIVNGTLESLLSLLPDNCQVAIAGPSCSFVPDILFENKINIIGATILNKPEEAMNLVGEAATGFHLFKSCAKKICLLNEHTSPS